jgi:hypothetical protein
LAWLAVCSLLTTIALFQLARWSVGRGRLQARVVKTRDTAQKAVILKREAAAAEKADASMRKDVFRDASLLARMPTEWIGDPAKLRATVVAATTKTAKSGIFSAHANFLRLKGVPRPQIPNLTKDGKDRPVADLLSDFAKVLTKLANDEVVLAPPDSVVGRLSRLRPFRTGKTTRAFEEYKARETVRRKALVEEAGAQALLMIEQEKKKTEAAQEKRAKRTKKTKKTKRGKYPGKQAKKQPEDEVSTDDSDAEATDEEDLTQATELQKMLQAIADAEQKALQAATRAEQGLRQRRQTVPEGALYQ